MKIELTKPEFRQLMEIVSLGEVLAKKNAKNVAKYDALLSKLKKYEAANSSPNATALMTCPHGASLEKPEIVLFFKLYLGLIHGVNEIKKVIPSYEKPVYGGKSIDFQKLILPVREKMWQNPDWITEYIEANSSELSDEEAQILRAWKTHFVSTRFIAMKHYKNCTALLGDNKLYAVRGISHHMQETIPMDVPCFLDVVLIPFKGRIIYDSIVHPYQIRFGGNMKASLNQEFKDIAAKHGIIETLGG